LREASRESRHARDETAILARVDDHLELHASSLAPWKPGGRTRPCVSRVLDWPGRRMSRRGARRGVGRHRHAGGHRSRRQGRGEPGHPRFESGVSLAAGAGPMTSNVQLVPWASSPMHLSTGVLLLGGVGLVAATITPATGGRPASAARRHRVGHRRPNEPGDLGGASSTPPSDDAHPPMVGQRAGGGGHEVAASSCRPGRG
jgi:hypothetical protein